MSDDLQRIILGTGMIDAIYREALRDWARREMEAGRLVVPTDVGGEGETVVMHAPQPEPPHRATISARPAEGCRRRGRR